MSWQGGTLLHYQWFLYNMDLVDEVSCMDYICKFCGGELKYYDKVPRMVRTKNREKSIIAVERLRCLTCNRINRYLPNNIFPYKQYDAKIIMGVIENRITSDIIDYENYPCEMTMARWRTLNLQSLL